MHPSIRLRGTAERNRIGLSLPLGKATGIPGTPRIAGPGMSRRDKPTLCIAHHRSYAFPFIYSEAGRSIARHGPARSSPSQVARGKILRNANRCDAAQVAAPQGVAHQRSYISRGPVDHRTTLTCGPQPNAAHHRLSESLCPSRPCEATLCPATPSPAHHRSHPLTQGQDTVERIKAGHSTAQVV